MIKLQKAMDSLKKNLYFLKRKKNTHFAFGNEVQPKDTGYLLSIKNSDNFHCLPH